MELRGQGAQGKAGGCSSELVFQAQPGCSTFASSPPHLPGEYR